MVDNLNNYKLASNGNLIFPKKLDDIHTSSDKKED